MILAFITPFFIWIKFTSASPLGKSIEITFVYADDTPIEGLTVDLYDGVENGYVDTLVTNAEGKVLFAGLIDETYTWKWSWQNIPAQRSEEITCSQIVWVYTETVAYWTLQKTFVYDVTGEPVKGLDVTLLPVPLVFPDEATTGPTNADGCIEFGKLKAGTYTLVWIWGGQKAEETVIIGPQRETPVVMTNTVGSKSGEA